MAKIQIEIPDNKYDVVIDRMSKQYQYKARISGPEGKEIDNPVNKEDFVKNIISSFIDNSCHAQKTNDDILAARKAADANKEDLGIVVTKIIEPK